MDVIYWLIKVRVITASCHHQVAGCVRSIPHTFIGFIPSTGSLTIFCNWCFNNNNNNYNDDEDIDYDEEEDDDDDN